VDLFCPTQAIEKKTAFQQEMHLLYVDLKKAFDNIPESKIWESLERTNSHINLIKAIQNLYKENTTRIKIAKRISKGFRVDKDLKQRCCLSPTLFKIYLEQALKALEK